MYHPKGENTGERHTVTAHPARQDGVFYFHLLIYNDVMITKLKIFENRTIEENMINEMFNRCNQEVYMNWMSNADIDLFTVDDKFDELEAKTSFLDEEYGIKVIEIEEQTLVSFDVNLPELEDIIDNLPMV